MTTQDSQNTFNVKVHFVVPDHYESENDCSEKMWQAFNKCDGLGLQPRWVNKTFCVKMQPTKNDVFIIEDFKGDLFEKLRNFRSSIVSPNCLLICFDNDEPIPEGNSPIYTTAMRGMCICASGLSPESKDQIQRYVEYMGGFFTKQFRNSVTHLVTDSVMSIKYEVAIDMKIPIMTKDWVNAVWDANLNEVVKADDEVFSKYKCPVFMNLVVTSTNLSKQQKEEVKRLIHDHGGTFMGPLDGAKVRVVIASENGPLSDKLKYAMDNGIACLKIDWVYKSIEIGYALPFRNFLIESTKACSTPEKLHTRVTLNCSDISSIPYDKHHNNYLNETSCTAISNFSTMELPNNFTGTATSTVLDRLSFGKAKLAGPFLDGCNIYLAGFATSVRDKLNRILNVGSATRLDDISDAVTHVIVGDENKASAELKVMKLRGLCPYVLSIEWLEESMKLKRPAPEECFLFETKGGAPKKSIETPASPLSKKNLQMLQPPKKPPVPSFNLKKDIPPDNEERQPDLVRQYLQETTVTENSFAARNSTVQEFARPRTPEGKDQENHNSMTNETCPKSIISATMQTKDPGNSDILLVGQDCMVDKNLFQGLTFVVTGFDNNEDGNPEDTIVTLSGRVVSNSYTGIPDYGVVPVQGAPLKHTVNEIVTDLFIEDCINQKEIVGIEYYHKPLSIRKPCRPLSECVITMSMYTGMERKYLSALGTELGAICQDIFSRKANAGKNVYGSTHLVCPTPEGNKYNAAVRWKLPAVTANWLKACADQLTLVDETSFLVGETRAPDRSTVSCINIEINPSNVDESEMNSADKTTRNIITPKRHLPQIKSQEIMSGDTPLINKRLSLVMNKTPQSPFHVSTPETPYGQIFKPDPSPDTRKGWVKWVENFPDLQVTEPPLKRRAPSTPLSELKRQLWEKLKNPGQSEKENASDEAAAKSNDNSLATRTEKKQDDDRSSKDSPSTPTLINRKLEFSQEGTPVSNDPSNEINMQIAQLDQVLQRTSSTPESRYSLSGENAKKYDDETSDHIQNYMVKDSQPVDAIVWEDPSHSRRSRLSKERIEEDEGDISEVQEPVEQDVSIEYECEPSSIRKFMLSGVKDRHVYERVIHALGGDVSMDANFDNSATHLLCIRPSRNEKMLGSIASGKWVLHCSYLRNSEQAGRFLDEEEYEWGNPRSKGTIPEPNGEIEQAIAAAAYRWRLKLSMKSDGPFSDMVALLLVSEEKYDQFKRLIEAGGGVVIQARPPYDASPTGRRITHCFVNVRQVNQPIDWAMLANKGILCFLPQYLSDYLTVTIPLNPRDCVLPEFKKYLALLPK
ncbi:PREDICTED: DNA topoisomerase 2-binding protein 1-A isoform X2 [Dinoponera quadriceps]|uniref:DNA topoisomerase 2-binding protein 1-A isoform X2 n=1 Tax=Dinoponera quadriceps TaxID=609295 RepID=A0A6P3XYH4_DINQU|nr:PREDICTED: DNA topoisomerase 2-binding protein 1-A isoform X2 [Dinoponera quadriceps]